MTFLQLCSGHKRKETHIPCFLHFLSPAFLFSLPSPPYLSTPFGSFSSPPPFHSFIVALPLLSKPISPHLSSSLFPSSITHPIIICPPYASISSLFLPPPPFLLIILNPPYSLIFLHISSPFCPSQKMLQLSVLGKNTKSLLPHPHINKDFYFSSSS